MRGRSAHLKGSRGIRGHASKRGKFWGTHGTFTPVDTPPSSSRGVQPTLSSIWSAGLRWRRWAGQNGGAGATPEGGGLRPIAEADAVGVDGAAFQGLELGAALVRAALRTMGVTDAATGKCTNEALADFISAWAGVTRASAIVSVCLAEDRDDNATRAASKAGVDPRVVCTITAQNVRS